MPAYNKPSLLRRSILLCFGLLVLATRALGALDLEGTVPVGWSATTAGSLTISSDHYKLGRQSLRWDWKTNEAITILNPAIDSAAVIDTTKNTACDFWYWVGVAQPGIKLRVEFVDDTTAQYYFDIDLNYTGWRRVVQSYKDMTRITGATSTFTSIRIIAPNMANGLGTVYIDNVTWAEKRTSDNLDVLDLETAVPDGWSATTPGSLSISSAHYKLGTQSLRWDWKANDVITITHPGINPDDLLLFDKNTCNFWVWNGSALADGKLSIEFRRDGSTAAVSAFEYNLNYTGWRRAIRSYRYDMNPLAPLRARFTSVIIKAPTSGSGSLFFDAVTWVGSNMPRIKDAQNLGIKGVGAITSTYATYAVESPLTASAPTTNEVKELELLRTRWLEDSMGDDPRGGNLKDLTAVKNSLVAWAATIKKATAPQVSTPMGSFDSMSIQDDPSTGIRGVPTNSEDYNALEDWSLTLARDYRWNMMLASPSVPNPISATAETSRDNMVKLARHLLDQGEAAQSNKIPPQPDNWSFSYNYRGLPRALILMAPAYTTEIKQQLYDYFRWAYNMGNFWTTDWLRNTDHIHLRAIQQLGAILFLAPTDAEAVRQLKGFKAYMDRFCEFSDGGEGGIKVDGVGFHHGSHYNSYMVAYSTADTVIYLLRETSFAVSKASYENLREAHYALKRMSAETTSGALGFYANSLTGRSSFSTDIKVNKWDLAQLEGMAAYYNSSNSNPIAPDGFYQFNYSPLGIYRRRTWVASIRAPQKYFWSAEIWTTANVYGRYQAYGALDILYHRDVTTPTIQIPDPKDNTKTINKTVTNKSGQCSDGWDWSQPPGTTTIALPHSDLGPKAREDVRSQLNFTGALSFFDGQSGLYASNFQEDDIDAAKKVIPGHNPTFVWRKSWFCFADQIVCLGSDISNQGAAAPTVTTLLQGMLVPTSDTFTLDGQLINYFDKTTAAKTPSDLTLSRTNQHWLLDTYSTGYLVPTGQGADNNNLKISLKRQTSAAWSGSSTSTTNDFAKAWLDHGLNPDKAAYEYVVFPGTNAADMAAVALAHDSAATKPYQVLERSADAHVVKWKASSQIGYAIFNTSSPDGALSSSLQNAGLLMAVERPCLVMTQLGTGDYAWISVVDPELNFSLTKADDEKSDRSQARTLDLTVHGMWDLDTLKSPKDSSIVSTSPSTKTTIIRVTTQKGLAQHVYLVAIRTPGLASWANLGTDWQDPVNWGSNWGGKPPANDPTTDIATFGTSTAQPVLNGSYSAKGINFGSGFTLSGSGNLTLGVGGVVATGTSGAGCTVALSSLTLQTSQTWDTGAGDLLVSSAINGVAGAGITKAGSGTLTLSGANTYTGGLTVTQGSVGLIGDQSGATGSINLNAAGTSLTIGTPTQTAPTSIVVGNLNSIVVGETPATGTADRILGVVGAPDFATTVTNNGSLTAGPGSQVAVGANSSWLQNGPFKVMGGNDSSAWLTVKDSGRFDYAGQSAIELNPATDNSGNALVEVSNGALFSTTRGFVFGSAGTGTGTGQFTLSGQGTLRLAANIADLFTGAASGRVYLGDGGGIIDTNGFTTTLSRNLVELPSALGNLTKTGAGTLTLTGTNAYYGATTITGGTLATGILATNGVPSGIGAGSGAANLIIDGGTLKYTGPTYNSPAWNRGYTVGANAGFDLSSASGQLWISGPVAYANSGPRTVTITTGGSGGRFGSNLGDGPADTTTTPPLKSPTTLIKQGTGTLLVTGTNTYSGPLLIIGGAVQYGNAGAGGESTGTGHSVVIDAGKKLIFRHANTAVTYNAPISGGGAVEMNYNNSSAGGSLTLGGDNTFSGGLTINPTNSNGATFVFPLKAGSPTALGSGNVTIGPYGTLDLNGFNNTTGLLVSSGNNGRVTNNGVSDAALTLGGAGTQTFGGILQDGSKKLTLIKSGAGTQILSGANTYTGDTTVGQGRLELAATGSLTFRPSANGITNRVTVASGATAIIRGTFVIDLTGADLSLGNSWQLVPGPSVSYDSTFQVTGFTKPTVTSGTVWTKIAGARTWTYSTATGVLSLLNSGYATWGLGYPALNDINPSADPDGDGVANIMEYVLGGNPTTADSAAILPRSKSTGTALIMEFHRFSSTENTTILTLQYTYDLSTSPWQDLVIDSTLVGPYANGVTYLVKQNAPAADLITVTVPVGPSGRVFARLHARQAP